MSKETHTQTLSNYVFYVNYINKNKDFYQAYIVGRETQINGNSEDGFIMNFYKTNKQSCECISIIDLYKAIRGENESINAYKITKK